MEPSALAEDIRNNARCWNLAGDGKILELMKKISNNLEERGNATNNSFKKLMQNVNQVELSLENTSNKLGNLQSTQFIENCIAESSSSITSNHEETGTKIGEKKKEDSSNYDPDEILKEILKISTATMEKYFEKTTVESDDSFDDEEEENPNNVFYCPKKIYKPALPYLIGSKEWLEKSNAELCSSDEEFSANEEGKDMYSSDSDNASIPSMAPTMSESESSIWGLQANFDTKRPLEEPHSSSEEVSSNTYKSKNSFDEPISVNKRPVYVLPVAQPVLTKSNYVHRRKPNNLFDESSEEELEAENIKTEKISNIPTTKEPGPIETQRYYVHPRKPENLFDESSEEETEAENIKTEKISNIPTRKEPVPVNLFYEELPPLDEVDESEEQEEKGFWERSKVNVATFVEVKEENGEESSWEIAPKDEHTEEVNANDGSSLYRPLNLFDDECFEEFLKNMNSTSKKLEKTKVTTIQQLLFDDEPPDDDFDALFEKPKAKDNSISGLNSRKGASENSHNKIIDNKEIRHDQNHNNINHQLLAEKVVSLKENVNLFDSSDSDDDILFGNSSVNNSKTSVIPSKGTNKEKKSITQANNKQHESLTKENAPELKKRSKIPVTSKRNVASASAVNENISANKTNDILFADNLSADNELFATTSKTISKSSGIQQESSALEKFENLLSTEISDDSPDHILFKIFGEDVYLNEDPEICKLEREKIAENSREEPTLEQNIGTYATTPNSREAPESDFYSKVKKAMLETKDFQYPQHIPPIKKQSALKNTLPSIKEFVNSFDDIENPNDKDVSKTTTSGNNNDIRTSERDRLDVAKNNTTNQSQEENIDNSKIIPDTIESKPSEPILNEVKNKSELEHEQLEESKIETSTEEIAESFEALFERSSPDDYDWLFTNTGRDEELENPSLRDTTANKEQPNNYISSSYNPLTLFQDIPPDDDFQPSADNAKRLQNIFYDDFYETVSPKSQDEETKEESSISANYIFSEEPPPDNYEIIKNQELTNSFETVNYDVVNDTEIRQNDTSDEIKDQFNNTKKTDEIIKEDALEISKSTSTKTKKLGVHLNINVAALLPGAKLPTSKSTKNDNEEAPKDLNPRESNLPHKIPFEVNKSNEQDENKESQGKRLHNLNKTRAKLLVKRKPSTRRARLANYEKSLNSDETPSFEQSSEENIVENVESETVVESMESSKIKSSQFEEPISANVNSQIHAESEKQFKHQERKPETSIKDNFPRDEGGKRITSTPIKVTKSISIFDDDDVSDDDLFGGGLSKTITSVQKSTSKNEIQIQHKRNDFSRPETREIEKNEPGIKNSLFSSDEDEDGDLFCKIDKSTSQTNSQQQQNRQDEKIFEKGLEKPFKKNLFSSDDDDDDLFGNTSNKSSQPLKKQQDSKTSTSIITRKKSSKTLFNSDEDLSDEDLFVTNSKNVKDNVKVAPKKLEPKPLSGQASREDNPLADLLKD